MNTTDIFTRIAGVGYLPKLADLKCTYQFNVDGAYWTVSVQQGWVRVAVGPSASPDCTIDCDDRDFMEFANGHPAVTLVMQGRIRVTGSLDGVLRLPAVFSQALRPAPQAIQEAR